MLRLEWGNMHSLSFIQKQVEGGVRGILNLRKAGGDQDVEFFSLDTMDPKPTTEMLRESWKAQNHDWDEVFLLDFPNVLFLAIRVIWLPGGWAIVWAVIHYSAAPHDLCGFVRISKNDSPFNAGKLIAQLPQ